MLLPSSRLPHGKICSEKEKNLPVNHVAPINFHFKDIVNMAGLKVGTDMKVSSGSNFNTGGSSSASASSQGGAGGAASGTPGGN